MRVCELAGVFVHVRVRVYMEKETFIYHLAYNQSLSHVSPLFLCIFFVDVYHVLSFKQELIVVTL